MAALAALFHAWCLGLVAMLLYVRVFCCSVTIIELHLDEACMVKQAKQLVAEDLGVHASRIKLLYNGACLKDASSLNQYGLCHATCLVAVIASVQASSVALINDATAYCQTKFLSLLKQDPTKECCESKHNVPDVDADASSAVCKPTVNLFQEVEALHLAYSDLKERYMSLRMTLIDKDLEALTKAMQMANAKKMTSLHCLRSIWLSTLQAARNV